LNDHKKELAEDENGTEKNKGYRDAIILDSSDESDNNKIPSN